MEFHKMITLIAASMCFCCFGQLNSNPSSDQEPWVIRMTLPAKLKLEKSIIRGQSKYTNLRIIIGHGQKRDDGSEFQMDVETVHVGYNKSKLKIQGKEKITLFGKDVWIDKDDKEKLKRSTIDLVYAFSNDGSIQNDILVLVESKPIDKVFIKSYRDTEIAPKTVKRDPSKQTSLSFISTSRQFVLNAIADQFGFQIEYKEYVDSNIGLSLRNVTWMEAFDLVLHKSGYHWFIKEGKVHVSKGENNLEVCKADLENKPFFRAAHQKQNIDFEFNDMVFSKIINEVSDEYEVNYVMLDSMKTDKLDISIETGGLHNVIKKLCRHFDYSIGLADDNVLILEPRKPDGKPEGVKD